MNYTFNDLMIAYIRGYIINNNIKVNENLIIKDINSLDSNEIEELISIGKSLDLKLYYFILAQLLYFYKSFKLIFACARKKKSPNVFRGFNFFYKFGYSVIKLPICFL